MIRNMLLVQIPRHLMIWWAEGRETIHTVQFQKVFVAKQLNLTQEQ